MTLKKTTHWRVSLFNFLVLPAIAWYGLASLLTRVDTDPSDETFFDRDTGKLLDG